MRTRCWCCCFSCSSEIETLTLMHFLNDNQRQITYYFRQVVMDKTTVFVVSHLFSLGRTSPPPKTNSKSTEIVSVGGWTTWQTCWVQSFNDKGWFSHACCVVDKRDLLFMGGVTLENDLSDLCVLGMVGGFWKNEEY